MDQWGSVFYFGVPRLADSEKQMAAVYSNVNHVKEKQDLQQACLLWVGNTRGLESSPDLVLGLHVPGVC